MQTLNQLAQANNFKMMFVSKSEHEDGVGACIGLNFIKDQVFYTLPQFAAELGLIVKVSSGKMQASSKREIEKTIIAQMKDAGVKAYQIKKNHEYDTGLFHVVVNYLI